MVPVNIYIDKIWCVNNNSFPSSLEHKFISGSINDSNKTSKINIIILNLFII